MKAWRVHRYGAPREVLQLDRVVAIPSGAFGGYGADVAFDAVSGDVTLKTFRYMAFNGRHVLAGFASGIEQEVEGSFPAPCRSGTSRSQACAHAYVDDPVVFKRLSGFNFPAHRDGQELHAELPALFAGGKLRPIVGQEVPFAELPAALEAMEQRRTVGRTVVRLPQLPRGNWRAGARPSSPG